MWGYSEHLGVWDGMRWELLAEECGHADQRMPIVAGRCAFDGGCRRRGWFISILHTSPAGGVRVRVRVAMASCGCTHGVEGCVHTIAMLIDEERHPGTLKGAEHPPACVGCTRPPAGAQTLRALAMRAIEGGRHRRCFDVGVGGHACARCGCGCEVHQAHACLLVGSAHFSLYVAAGNEVEQGATSCNKSWQ